MPIKTNIVIITALLLGSASVASATEFDPNPANRYPAYNEPIATQLASARIQRGFVRAPAALRGRVRARVTTGTRNPVYHPNANFSYGPQIDYPSGGS